MTQLRAGVAGAGVFGGFHARKYANLEGVTLAGIFDPDAARGTALADELSATAHTDLPRFLEGLDVVTIATPGATQVQVAQLPDGARFLCFARAMPAPQSWGEPAPVHVLAMGCDIGRAQEIVYGDGIDLERAAIGIGLSCRLCDRPDCRSRAFPPLEHRLALDPLTTGASPYPFLPQK